MSYTFGCNPLTYSEFPKIGLRGLKIKKYMVETHWQPNRKVKNKFCLLGTNEWFSVFQQLSIGMKSSKKTLRDIRWRSVVLYLLHPDEFHNVFFFFFFS